MSDTNTEKGAGLGKSLIYSGGQFGGNILNMMFVGWVMFYYTKDNSGAGSLMSITLFGAIFAASKIIDAIIDPLVCYLSDNTKSRFGRRRPYMIVATPVMVITYIMLFHPLFPAGSSSLAICTGITMIIFWIAFTVMMSPYLALMPEIAATPKDRVMMSTLLSVMVLLATAFQGIIAPKFLIPTLGYSKTAIITGLAAGLFTYITIIGIREKPGSTTVSHEKYSFLEAFLWTFKNKPFVIYICASIFQYIGFAGLTASIPFIVTRLMNKPESFVSTLYLVTIPGFVISFFLVNFLTKKFDKALLYKITLLLLALFFPLLWFFGRINLPVAPAIAGMIFMGLMSVPIAGNMVLPMTLIADIVDYDEKLTGRRREAMYFGMSSLLQKIANALSAFLQASLFGIFGYSMQNHLGINLLGPVAGLFGLMGFLVFLFYPLDEKTKMLKGAKSVPAA